MFPRISLLIFPIFNSYKISAQISTEPGLPMANQKVTITFDSSKEGRLGYFRGDLYAHTGVILEGNSNWQHLIVDTEEFTPAIYLIQVFQNEIFSTHKFIAH